MTRFFSSRSSDRSVGNLAPDELKSAVDDYTGLSDADAEQRKATYGSISNLYYTLVTDFYEFGWGQSFHFAPRRRDESFKDSLLRHEYFLADRLSLQQGMQVLDVGCGVGGPMANLARHTGANFVGINLNEYQIERAKRHTRDVQAQCRFIHGDYMQVPEADDHFDAAFEIEATCHAADKTGLFREILRVLRPGGYFAGYAWCLTDQFDPSNAEHARINEAIVRYNGIQDLALTSEYCTALEAAGFELVEARDLAHESDPETPWYRALQGRDLGLASIPRTPIGRALTTGVLRVAETLRLVPQGARTINSELSAGADALVEGGEASVFTPVFYYLARKPERNGD